jgi:hypothetical protein
MPVQADGLKITPVKVNNVVPTFGYIVDDGKSAVIFVGDSGPTDRLWEVAHQTRGVSAVFMEACFPNSMTRLADVALHLTPEMFGREVAKMSASVFGNGFEGSRCSRSDGEAPPNLRSRRNCECSRLPNECCLRRKPASPRPPCGPSLKGSSRHIHFCLYLLRECQ